MFKDIWSFSPLTFLSGWETPPGYPEGFNRKYLPGL